MLPEKPILSGSDVDVYKQQCIIFWPPSQPTPLSNMLNLPPGHCSNMQNLTSLPLSICRSSNPLPLSMRNWMFRNLIQFRILKGRGVASSAFLTGVWVEREVKIKCSFVDFALHKPQLGVSMFIGHCLDFKPSSEKIF